MLTARLSGHTIIHNIGKEKRNICLSMGNKKWLQKKKQEVHPCFFFHILMNTRFFGFHFFFASTLRPAGRESVSNLGELYERASPLTPPYAHPSANTQPSYRGGPPCPRTYFN